MSASEATSISIYTFLYNDPQAAQSPPGKELSAFAGKTRDAALAIQGSLWLDRKGKNFLGDNRIELLESIERTGSTRAPRRTSA